MNNDLQDRLRTQLDTQAHSAPPAPALGEVIQQCERDLSRHRRRLAAVAAGAVAAGVAVAVTVPFLLSGAADDSSKVASDGKRASDAVLIETCRNGSQPAYWTDLVFASGTPRISARSDANAAYSSTILVSADGDYWADCRNAENAWANSPGALDDGPGRTNMTVYESIESLIPPFGAGQSCPANASGSACIQFIVDFVDRLPAEVARVEFLTADGETTVVDANADGFVLFDHEGVVLPGYGNNEQKDIHWITQMTYLDADDNPLAANRWAGQHLSPKPVDELPELTDYPSLARQVQDLTAPGDRG